MRLDEIAQLRICDLKQDEETSRWYFSVDRSGGRSTKTASSIRSVPVHRELIRVGLLHYRQSLIDGGAGPKDSLWPDVKAERGRQLSSAWSKWFGRYLRNKCGITDSAKVFHSFRHTFKRMTRDAELPEELHDALTGHAGNGSVGRTYGRGISLKPLVRAIDKVRSPVELKLHWKQVRRG
jgi:integrase